jgi:small-conductance mechanosensitive channel
MSSLTAQPWFWPALAVVVGLPVALLILNEVQGVLVRRGSAYAKPIGLLRNWLLPAAAVYLLIDQLNHGGQQAVEHATWAKIAATVVGFVIMLVLLSGANAALFGAASAGSWRSRLPGIFIDLGRLILIIIGIGLLLSWVWGANIGGLITAVGVTSIVIGLAVQNAVGPVISGLLLLFEQPFRIGDYLDTKFGKGRVAEVNWRAVHIDTENGIQIIPNAALAGDAFINLSRTTAPFFKAKATFSFAAGDPPGVIKSTLQAMADAAPMRRIRAWSAIG